MANVSPGRIISPRTPHLVLVNGDKGGVGKSFACNVIVWRMLELGRNIVGVDGDSRNGHLDRFYGQTIPVSRHDLREEGGWSAVYDLLNSLAPGATLVVDLPAGAGHRLSQEASRFRLAIAEIGCRLSHIWVATFGEDSVRLFREQQHVAAPTDTLFLRNCISPGDEDRFSIWCQSKTRAEFLNGGGTEAVLPNLSAIIVACFAEAHAPFHDITLAGLRFSQRISFLNWSAAVDQHFAPALTLLKGN